MPHGNSGTITEGKLNTETSAFFSVCLVTHCQLSTGSICWGGFYHVYIKDTEIYNLILLAVSVTAPCVVYMYFFFF